jgi:hypothetical protein
MDRYPAQKQIYPGGKKYPGCNAAEPSTTDNPAETNSKLASEAQQLAAIGAWCTPEFLIESSRNREIIQRVGETSRARSTAAGQYLAHSQPLAGPGQIDEAIAELRRLLESRGKRGGNRSDLLQVWMSIERCLALEEHRELQAAVISWLFPESQTPSRLSREAIANLGGR